MTRYDHVVGIDPSLTATGHATIHPDGTTTVTTIRSSGHRNATAPTRSRRIEDLATRINDHTPPRSLVVIEGPSYGSIGAGTWDRGGLWHAIIRRHPHLAVIAPQTRARWATGKGNADKAAVAAHIARMCPDVELGGSDEADALALALMGAHALSWRDDGKARREVLLKGEWPERVTALLLEPYEQRADTLTRPDKAAS